MWVNSGYLYSLVQFYLQHCEYRRICSTSNFIYSAEWTSDEGQTGQWSTYFWLKTCWTIKKPCLCFPLNVSFSFLIFLHFSGHFITSLWSWMTCISCPSACQTIWRWKHSRGWHFLIMHVIYELLFWWSPCHSTVNILHSQRHWNMYGKFLVRTSDCELSPCQTVALSFINNNRHFIILVHDVCLVLQIEY